MTTRLPGEAPVRAIPKRLHMFWHDDATMPAYVRAAIEHNIALHPGFDCIVADDAYIEDFLRAKGDERVLELYRRNTIPASRSDLARLLLLVEHGGYYVDANKLAVLPLDAHVRAGSTLLLVRGAFGTLTNNAMAAVPGHPLLAAVLARALDNLEIGHFNDYVVAATGPHCLIRVIERLGMPPDVSIAQSRHVASRAAPEGPEDAHGYDDWRAQQAAGILQPVATSTERPPISDRDAWARLLEAEEDYGATARSWEGHFGRASAGDWGIFNVELTGDAQLTWLRELASRGPFPTVGVQTFGDIDLAGFVREARVERLFLYAPLAAGLERMQKALSLEAPGVDVTLTQAPVNAVTLPASRFDLFLSHECLERTLDLEGAVDAIAASLRPGGSFALFGFVGDDGYRASPRRLELAGRVAGEIADALGTKPAPVLPPADLALQGPLAGVRSSEVLSAVRAVFDERHLVRAFVTLMTLVMARQPELLRALRAWSEGDGGALERAIVVDRSLRGEGLEGELAYGVFAKRPA